jgi:ATP-dependent Clp protease ATP-binding subunit ClpB
MPLDPNRWTLKTNEAVQAAIDSARRASHAEATPDHLLAAMLGQEGTATLPTLEKVGAAPLSVRNRVADALAKVPRAYGGQEAGVGREVKLKEN